MIFVNLKKILATSLSLLFTAPLSTLAMREYIDENKELNKNNTKLCVICLDDDMDNPTRPIMLTGCNHKFHTECMKFWRDEHETCPMCRRDLIEDDIKFYYPSETIDIKDLPNMAGKNNRGVIDELINMCAKYKGLGFRWNGRLYSSAFCGNVKTAQHNYLWPKDSFYGYPLVLEHEGRRKHVCVNDEELLRQMKDRFEEFNQRKMDEEHERWSNLTSEELDNEIKKYEKYLRLLARSNENWAKAVDKAITDRSDLARDYKLTMLFDMIERKGKIKNRTKTFASCAQWGAKVGILLGLGASLLA